MKMSIQHKNLFIKKQLSCEKLPQIYLAKIILITTITLFSLGCSNNDVAVHYYSLNTIQPQNKNTLAIKKNKERTFVVINNIKLADFLNTGGLVMQIDSHQIQISNQHRWADKLSKTIRNHLINSLSNGENNHLYVEATTSQNKEGADINVSLNFEQFTITQEFETIISGFYLIESSQPKHNTIKTYFDIRQTLSQNGYNHAVKTYQQSMSELSQQIKNTIDSTI